MKKITVILFVFITIFCFQANNSPDKQIDVNDQKQVAGDWQYTINEGTISITGYTGSESILEIPAEIDNIPVTMIGDEVFRDHTELTKIWMPDSILTIGKAAFSGCTSLKQIRLSASLEKILNEGFRYCTSLESIEFPAGLISIGNNAFEECSLLKELVLPESLVNISANAFRNCRSLISINIQKNVKTIGGNAFWGTSWLDNQTEEFVIVGNRILIKYNGSNSIVDVPVSVTSIVDAFSGNIQIEKVVLPDTLLNINDNSFKDCINLREIQIPQKITSIGSYAFANCRSLQEIEIPENVSWIGDHAFEKCEQLKKVRLPVVLKSIGERMFDGCSSLETVSIPASVKQIHETAFDNCPNLNLKVVFETTGETFAKEKSIPFKYLSQKNEDYSYLKGENGIEILDYIGQVYHVKVPSILDGQNVWKIGPGAFQENSFARDVILSDTIREIGEWAFSYSESLKSVSIADGTSKIGANAFTGCPNLTEVFIPSSVSEIGTDAFRDCPNVVIQSVSGSYASKEAQQLDLNLIDPLTISGDFRLAEEDGKYILVGYTGSEKKITLLSEILGRKITHVGNNIFQYASMEEIIIPEGYISIGDYAFANMAQPLTIYLPDSLTEISDNAFEGTESIFKAHTGTAAEAYARKYNIKFLVHRDDE
jgi:hypothetical protein